MTWSIAAWTLLVMLMLAAVHAGITMLLALRTLWLMRRSERRLKNARCPKCDYPLRFNMREHWCSECGYRHPLHTDAESD